MTVFWDIAPCSLVNVYRRFRGTYCLHHQGNCLTVPTKHVLPFPPCILTLRRRQKLPMTYCRHNLFPRQCTKPYYTDTQISVTVWVQQVDVYTGHIALRYILKIDIFLISEIVTTWQWVICSSLWKHVPSKQCIQVRGLHGPGPGHRASARPGPAQ
jgi:hypothetical protein